LGALETLPSVFILKAFGSTKLFIFFFSLVDLDFLLSLVSLATDGSVLTFLPFL